MNKSDLSGFNPITDGNGEHGSRSGQERRNALARKAHPSPKKLAENKCWDLSSISRSVSLHNLGLISSFVIT